MSARAIISSLPSVMLNQSHEMAYKFYVTNALQLICSNTAYSARQDGGDGRYIKNSYSEIINPKPEETRTGQEIIDMMKNKIAEIGGEPD